MTRKPDILDAAKEAERRQLGPLRRGAFLDGAASVFDGARLPPVSLRALGWRMEGDRWARRALQTYEVAP